MKNTIIVLIALLISVSTFAQPESINYKAVIKDASGNLVVSQTLNVKFTILKNMDNSIVYEETHTNETTDANGIMIVNIGQGTSTGNIVNVNWGSDIHILKTEIDLEQDDSFVNLGQTSFNAVPYALYAPDRSSGLEKITEEATPGVFNTGWRLKDVDPNVFGPIGLFALDLTTGGSQTNDFGATGFYSIAIGSSVRASGEEAISIGTSTNAESYRGTAMGSNNIGGGTDNSWFPEDPLFEIGNSIDSNNKSNALTVLKNGTITAPSLTNSLINTAGDKALVTKEYLEANESSGLEKISQGDNTGWRLKGVDPNDYAPIGDDAIDLSIVGGSAAEIGASGLKSFASGSNTKAIGDYSTAMGFGATATGYGSTAMGYGAEAIGLRSTAMGSVSKALNIYSTAMGNITIASGYSSTAMGDNTIASGFFSTALGRGTRSESYNSLAIGRYNIGGGYAGDPNDPFTFTNMIPTDPLFEIGNGSTSINRNNALTVYKNGDAKFDGEIQHTSTGSRNLIPIAYGSVNGTGGIAGGTGNFTVSIASNVYTITVTGKTLTRENTSVSVIANTASFRNANATYANGKLLVHLFTSSFNKVQSDFQFIIYQE